MARERKLKEPAAEEMDGGRELRSRSGRRVKRKYRLRSNSRSDRVPRSGSKANARGLKVVSSGAGGVGDGDEDEEVNRRGKGSGRKRGKKNNRGRNGDGKAGNEFSRIRNNLSYMLHKIRYERSLIDAYSGEGWKGMSSEKLKPEKELQRATSEIVHRKMRIRDIFRQIDSHCLQGKLPEELFDGEGMIDSEDIFCAKCGSKDLTLDNDIILCDGGCDRGFHQFCLEPPLLKEQIPPGDEGWLCPACDCKVDCIDMLNKSQGTDLSFRDSWEKIFPEVAASGNSVDRGLSSDDCEDGDYNPDSGKTIRYASSDGSSSSESGYATASEKLEISHKNQMYTGLPSDDSEDNDYDPDAGDPKKDEEESLISCSDFSSDSEDLAAVLKDSPSKMDDGDSFKGAERKRPMASRRRSKEILNEEMQSPLEADSGEDDSGNVVGKRIVDRLDYKKLHDEAYGNISSDSSEDEDWTVHSGKRKRHSAGASSSPDGGSLSEDDFKPSRRRNVSAPRNRSSRIVNSRTKKDSPHSHDNQTPKSVSTGGGSRRSTYRRLGETVTLKLYEAFQKNQYPDAASRDSLAEELGITPQQVRKWFENARWSYNHPGARKVTVFGRHVKRASTLLEVNVELCENNSGNVVCEVACNGSKDVEPMSEHHKKETSGGNSAINQNQDNADPGQNARNLANFLPNEDMLEEVPVSGYDVFSDS
ncbi:hypothetical protein MLD38_032435 [Melastoma candidum]|uniref:Uncharacterized protein n=1 Tax=Melastoma candidum TaxID=119954 RepID=A0ACB9M782_9MYRT|nr:hypothetical protein MLD38_032435 [Melastoma candidum]